MRYKGCRASLRLTLSQERRARRDADREIYRTFVQKLLGIRQPHRAAQLGVGKEARVRAGDKDRVLLIDFF
jgi:hypothetical protein